MRSRQEYEALLKNPNVQRGLAVIRATEGTAKYADPYSTAFGGRQFDTSKGHPKQLWSFKTKSGKKQKTSASGAYQFLNKTWSNVANKLDLQDMSPANQDIAAVALIDGRGGLDALVQGDMKTFVEKAGPEWASLPTAPKSYDQPTKGWDFVEQAWNSAPVDGLDTAPSFDIAQSPMPADRPFDSGGILNPSQAGSLSPISTANAGEMPNGGLLTYSPTNAPAQAPQTQDYNPQSQMPNAGLLGGQYEQYQRGTVPQQVQQQAQPVQQPSAGLLADQYAQYQQSQAQPAPSPEDQLMQQSLEPASYGQGIVTSLPQIGADGQIIPNTVEQVMPQPVAQPVAAPVQQPVQPQPLQQQQFDQRFSAPEPQAPPPPSGNDVWNGKADYGVANGGYELTRQQNGDVYRYSPKYDQTELVRPDGSSNVIGKGNISAPQTAQPEQNGFSLSGIKGFEVPKAKTNAGNMTRGVLGSVAGGLAGGFLGPLGGLLGAALGKNIAQGGGLLGSQMTQGHSTGTYKGQPVNASMFPDAPNGGNRGSGSSWEQSTYDSARSRGFSDKVSSAAASGKGGLF